jgi:FixJ family two-component response regulator
MLGAVDYLRKPFAMDVMLEAVKNAIGASEVEKKPAPNRRRVLKKKDEDE